MPEKLVMTAAQCRAARALLDWPQERLAAESKVGAKTIVDFEQGRRDPFARTIRDLQETLEAAGIEFTNGTAPGLRLKRAAVGGRGGAEGRPAARKAAAPRRRKGGK